MAGRNGKLSIPFFLNIEKGISSYFVKPQLSDALKQAVILAYHNISSITDNSVLEADSVTSENFKKQMRFLSEHNFNAISLNDLAMVLRQRGEIKNRTVVLTFDDGYKTFLLNALPVLQKYNLPATVFLAVDSIGTNKPFLWLSLSEFKTNENLLPMDWHDILELKHNGVDIGSHTCSHRFLPAMRRFELEKEVIHSGDVIEEKIGMRPRSFALPYSFPLQQKAWPDFQMTLFNVLEYGGYEVCCTSIRGAVDSRSHPFRLARFFITKYDDLFSFHAKAVGAFSWTRVPQSVYQKYFKNYEKVVPNLRHVDLVV